MPEWNNPADAGSLATGMATFLGNGSDANRDGVATALAERGFDATLFDVASNTIISDADDVIALYDTLVAGYADYVTKSSLGSDDYGNTIYQYVFSPGNSVNGNEPVIPKIVYVTGAHGHERGAIVTGFAFFKALCAEWHIRPDLEALRWGCEFVVVPALNASGITANTRKNGSGVDLNRNASTDWSTGGSTDPGDDTYRGPSALSEPETVIAVGLATTHSDAAMMIDHHNSSPYPSSQDYVFWCTTRSARAKEVFGPALRQMSAALRKLDGFTNDNTALQQITTSSGGGIAVDWHTAGLPSFVLETPPYISSDEALAKRVSYRCLVAMFQAVMDTAIAKQRVEAAG